MKNVQNINRKQSQKELPISKEMQDWPKPDFDSPTTRSISPFKGKNSSNYARWPL
jgi:hypothetical protein